MKNKHKNKNYLDGSEIPHGTLVNEALRKNVKSGSLAKKKRK